MPNKLKAVIDTNIFLSGLLNESGAPAKLIKYLKNDPQCFINPAFSSITKMISFSIQQKIKQESLKINPQLTIFEVSGKTNQGLVDWFEWLRARVKEKNGTAN